MDARISSQEQFSKNAEKYRDEPLFSEGEDLRRMVKSVSLSGTERLLDIGTGAGHTALAFAPHVEMCVGIDLTEKMVRVASEMAVNRNVSNVQFQVGDAENLPFEEASFDLVTCRFAAHHFPDLKKAVGEIARVLKPGGIFLLVDHYAPEETELDVFVNQLNRLRDPSHVRESSLSEWRDLLTQHGLFYREIVKWDLPIQFHSWVERSGTPYEVREKLVEMLKTASPLCQASFRITFAEDGNPRSFCLKAVLLHGVK